MPSTTDMGALAALAKSALYPELEARTRELLARYPQSGVLWKILGVALWTQGQDAFESMGRAVELLPSDAEAHANLANVLRARGQLEGALRSYRRALDLNPQYPEAHNNLGSVLQDVGRLEEAMASFRQATLLKPDFALAHGNLGNVLSLLDRLDECEASCRRALELNPHLTAALVQLAEAHARRGEFDAAEELLKRAIAIEPDMPEAWAGPARLKKMSIADADWLAAAQRIAAQSPPPRREVYLRYALGKYFDDVGDYPQAFVNYQRANELAKVGRPKHDRAQFGLGVDQIVQTFNREWLNRVGAAAHPSERPVFIVGMPRSGTTLTEQILASHAAVFGAGELSFWNSAASEYAAIRGRAEDLRILRRFAEDYLRLIDSFRGVAPRVIDKMPANFLHMGLMHGVLPKAKFIHLQRHPIDTCLSIYFQNFDAKHTYANDLDDLAHYHREYMRLMDHWRRVLPAGTMLEVPYEGLVVDTEGWTRRMLEFIDLPWNAACLEFHRNTRTVATSSKWQARQKIHRSSVERWRHYEKHLGPLLQQAETTTSHSDPAILTSRLASLANARQYRDMEILAAELISVQPQSGFGWKALGAALQMQGKDAFTALDKAARLRPQDPDCHGNLGSALLELGRLDEAAASYGRALELKADTPELWNNLGNVQKELGRFEAAVTSYRHALELRPNFATPHNNLGVVLQNIGRIDDAAASFKRALVIDPGYVDAHVNLGIALRLQNRVQDAAQSCRRALELDPSSIAALRLQAEMESDQGDFGAAESTLNRAIEIEPDFADAWAGIAGLRRMTRDDEAWLAGAQRLVARSSAPSGLHLRYALGKYFDDVGDYDEAFANFRQANELAKRSRPPHDRQLLRAGMERVIATQDKKWLAAAADRNPSERPVFIVGMPRSGTTLAEQILASHPGVYGAGELPFWNTAGEMTARVSDGRHGDFRGSSRWAPDYLALLNTLSVDTRRVVDKMPANFWYLGLIHAALPNAKIIHMCRHPIDTCLSIYFQNFGGIHSYATDLDDLAHYYEAYLRLMDHWRICLPAGAILQVPYEGLVEETESWSRRMLDFIALPWDPNCLTFHRCAVPVKTFSKWQVRQPISKSSVDRWRRYQKFVGPLRRLIPST